ncbi:MAG TPA: endonuclease domain-containing protein [Candidatus Bathyarchaeia archaeon]|nr:endonuclease domain-containing protein [Candidatus Bathyarchaeia archaeon]
MKGAVLVPRNAPLEVREPRHDYARDLRSRLTDAERRLWAHLRNRRLLGVKFCRQDPVGPYIADFCAREIKLIVELDGGQHAGQVEYDARRTRYLEAKGYQVIRFWDNDVLRDTNAVLEEIARIIGSWARRAPHPDPLPRGEREGGEGGGR